MRKVLQLGQKFSVLGVGGNGGGGLAPKVITVPSDYPTIVEANKETGRLYLGAGAPSVVDDDPTKTNTGFILLAGHHAVWTGSSYFDLGSSSGMLYQDLTPQLTSPGKTVFTLANTPDDPLKTQLFLRGNKAVYGVDFTVVGNTLNWTGIALKQNTDLDERFEVYTNVSTAPSTSPIFAAYNTSVIGGITGDETLADIIMPVVEENIGGHYNPLTGEFEAPFKGMYQFDINYLLKGFGGGHVDFYIKFNVTGGAASDWQLRRTNPTNDKDGGASGYIADSKTITMRLTAGQIAKFQIYTGDGAKSVNIEIGTRISGRLVQAL